MPYSPRVKALAHTYDPECWISYSGWDADAKRAIDARRNAALQWADENIWRVPWNASVEEIAKPLNRKSLPVNNVITLEILLHCFYACEPFHRQNSEAYRRGVVRLLKDELIEPTTELERSRATGWAYKATEKGRVFVNALTITPLPVPAEPKWVMPNA